MRFGSVLCGMALLAILAASAVQAQETEQDIVNRYLQKAVTKHTQKAGWASINVSMDRINRQNDYNDFATIESQDLSSGTFGWIEQGFSIGADFGMIIKERFAWSLGGEYWLKMGDELPANADYYIQSSGTTVTANPKSEVTLYGASTSLYYYVFNPPKPVNHLSGLSLRVGGTVGFYGVSWDLWPEYENLNLSTSEPVNSNAQFKDNAPGFSFGVGVEYPLNFWDLAISTDASYLYLNFNQVSWYNSQDEEIVASIDGSEDGRVDLDFSGVRGKVEIKKFFSW